ncbi:SPFH/Band 7/PHB domain protein [Candidatus Bathyarchaeota archaeon]|nr:SPFH/Band 7/PHB domain protein [Candidatus Bathyarchaeota archaeon]
MWAAWSSIGGTLLLIAALLFIIGILSTGVKTVNQFERGVIERFGAYTITADPGLKFIVPLADKMLRINMREQVIDVPPQEIITEDNVVVSVDAVVYYQIMDPVRALYEIEDFELAIVKLAQTTLRNVVGEMTLDTCLTSREKINLDLRKVLDEATDKWGTKVNRIEVQRIDPPMDIQTAMHKQKTAEQERRQFRLLATGRKEAANQDREATIMRAEGEAKSIELVAKAEAEAIRLVSESANKYFTENAQINKKLDVIRDTFSNATKIVVPSDSDVLNILGMDSGANVVPIVRKGEGEKQKSTL